MKLSFVAVLVAFSTMTLGATSLAADVKGVQGEIFCEITTPEKDWFGWQFNITYDGIIEGVAQRKDAKGVASDIGFEATYELRDGALNVYKVGEVTRVRPGRTLPNVEVERQDLYRLKHVKMKEWALNVFHQQSGRMVKTTIPCREYDPAAKPPKR